MTADDSRLPDLGPRGEGWFAAQVVLIATIGLAGLVDLGRGNRTFLAPPASEWPTASPSRHAVPSDSAHD